MNQGPNKHAFMPSSDSERGGAAVSVHRLHGNRKQCKQVVTKKGKRYFSGKRFVSRAPRYVRKELQGILVLVVFGDVRVGTGNGNASLTVL